MSIKESIDRAIILMGTPSDYKNYIAIKIKPLTGGFCCCFHCWPQTWKSINEYIHPYGPLQDEGAVLIERNNEKFVLECHESGPEIITYSAVSINLLAAIINLIVTLLKARQNEPNRHSAKFKITKQYQIRGKLIEEEIIELKLPLSKDIIKKLDRNIRNAFKKRKITKNKPI